MSEKKPPAGLYITPKLASNLHPFDELQWSVQDVQIKSEGGQTLFRQKAVEAPSTWDEMSVRTAAFSYFRNDQKKETSVRHLVDRVATQITEWGWADKYFASEIQRNTFCDELTWILVNQYAAFNSAVWFNVGREETPQCSNCFINKVDDTMESILELNRIQGMIFKQGSGVGVNLSPLRSSQELLSGGGQSSGPISFMKGLDAFAGVIRQGGKTRRAARMLILDVDHPDIVDFVECKEKEEKKAHTLIANGYDGSLNGEAYASVFFQNGNNSVRCSDEFMQAVAEDAPWALKAVTTNKTFKTVNARSLMNKIAKASWTCGCPGLQFSTTINEWHTVSNTAPINASNACSEFVFLDDTACNLASINLLKFLKDDGTFDTEKFLHVVRVMLIGQEIIVDRAKYPTPDITRNSKDFRPLGLGIANLGAYLMARGLPYDSDEARGTAASIVAALTGYAYTVSAEMAQVKGPFPGYKKNTAPMMKVIRKHKRAAAKIPDIQDETLRNTVDLIWMKVEEEGKKTGFRNAQVSLIAPTGTIGFLMGCDTTGLEPVLGLVSYKRMVNKEDVVVKLVNRTVPKALESLGYSQEGISNIVRYIDEHDTIEGAPDLEPQHFSVFDCAFVPANGTRSISPDGHLKMMAALQPLISGAMSKTVNLPANTKWEDVRDVFFRAWKMGIKVLTVYRDGSKKAQPLSTAKPGAPKQVERRKLPAIRGSLTHQFQIGNHKGYLTCGLYEDGSLGEIFLTMAKSGSSVAGLTQTLACIISIALQYGVPLEALANAMMHTKFEPHGLTSHPDIRIAKSVTDYISKFLLLQFSGGNPLPQEDPTGTTQGKGEVTAAWISGPPCPECGSITVPSGSCHKCVNCGASTGCG